MPSQIMQLPSRSGYLKLAGGAESKKLSFDFVEFPAGTEPYVSAPASLRDAAE